MIGTRLVRALGTRILQQRMLGVALCAGTLIGAFALRAGAQERFDDPTMPRTRVPDTTLPPTTATPLKDVEGGEIIPGGETLAPGEGEIYNLTDKPFTFRMHRKFGTTWTPYYTLAPGTRYVSRGTNLSEILGITGDGKGYVTIQFPDLGGLMTVRLPARAPSTGKFEPTWFCIKDATGIIRMVQAESPEAAQVIQQQLQKELPLTPAQVEQLKFTLRSNWVYSDSVDTSSSVGRGAACIRN